MPGLSVWMLRAALLYLGTGFTLGALVLLGKAEALPPVLWRLLPVHVEFLLVGWTIQLAMGVAYWILPRFQIERGRVWLAGSAFGLLNGGVILASLGNWYGLGGMIFTGRLAELLAVLAFALHAWPRIKPLGAPANPKQHQER